MLPAAALLSFKTLRHSNDFRRWGDLANHAPPFLAPEFFELIRPLAGPGVPLVAEAWSASGVLGALPMVLDGTTLHGMQSEHSPRYDFCGTADAIDAIWDCLRHDARWSELVFERVPHGSLLATRLPELAGRDGCPVVVRADTRQPFFELAGFEAAIDPKFRANLLRCARDAGGVTLERLAVPTGADFAEATAIEAMARKGDAGTSLDDDPRVAHLYRALALLLGRRGHAALYFLRANGKRIATLFGVEDQHSLFALKIGFDPSFANVSPGHLLILEVARDAERRGLAALDLVGPEDDWKHTWTDRTHDQIALTIYQRSARGLVRYGLHELVKPMLPDTVRTTPLSPLPRRCQRTNLVGDHDLRTRLERGVQRGLGVRRRVRGMLTKSVHDASLGEPSKFAVGSWVRVRDRGQIEDTLDDHDRTRGLAFVPVQWAECGQVHRVVGHVRRIRDDRGRFRPVSRTVIFEDSDCGGRGAQPCGCGRHCPLMYRDEWLEEARAPHRPLPLASTRPHARVRDTAEIYAGLDLFGRRDGVTFMPEMAAYAGRRYPIARRITEVFELDKWRPPRRPLYILDGLHCTGALTGANGPCDRACSLLWHEDWLLMEDP